MFLCLQHSDISVTFIDFIYHNECLLGYGKRGYIILIIGAVLLISGIVISILWAGSFAGTIIRENTVLSGVSIKPAGSVNASTQVIDTSRPVSLAIHVERNNSTTWWSNTK